MKRCFFFLGVLAFAAGHPASDSRIVAGTPAGSAIPYVVSIQENDAHICGGFIYNQKTVITTASCVKGKGPASLKVSVNDYKFINSQDNAGEKKVAVFKIIPHEAYDSTTSHLNDLAVVELAEPIELAALSGNDGSLPSCINYDEVLTTYTEGTVYGWGLSEVDGPISTTLKMAQVNMEKSDKCVEPAVTGFNSSGMVCTSNPTGVDPLTALCDADGGAPLVIMDDPAAPTPMPTLVVGIYSFSGGDATTKCEPTLPSVFTRLSVYYAWLARNAGSQPNCLEDASPLPPALV